MFKLLYILVRNIFSLKWVTKSGNVLLVCNVILAKTRYRFGLKHFCWQRNTKSNFGCLFFWETEIMKVQKLISARQYSWGKIFLKNNFNIGKWSILALNCWYQFASKKSKMPPSTIQYLDHSSRHAKNTYHNAWDSQIDHVKISWRSIVRTT